MNGQPKIYLAAPWVRKADAVCAAQHCQDRGLEVTSHWFKHQGDPNDSAGLLSPLEQIQSQAWQDIEDIESAHYVVVLNLEKSEGKAVETGYAIARGIPVISVGPRSNIFQSLGVEVATLDQAIRFILHDALHIFPKP